MNFFPHNLNPLDAGVTPQLAKTGRASLSFTLGLSAKPFGLNTDRLASWGGRGRIGDDISLSLQVLVSGPFSPHGIVDPDSPPIVRVYSMAPSPPATKAFLVPDDQTSGGATGAFRGTFVPGSGDSAARYVAYFAYTVNGNPKAQVSPFEVLPGGHPSAQVLSEFATNQPSGQSFLAHQGSGRVSLGLRPYLDSGD